MKVEFLYFEDCPSHEQALARLQQVMQEQGVTAEVDIIKVETDEQAQAMQFVGSPTILVNGQDIVPPVQGAIVGLSCRVYRLEDGRFSPLPSVGMIRQAFTDVE